MKKILVLLLVAVVLLSQSVAFTENKPQKAAFITQYGLNSPFTKLCWQGYEKLEKENGWEIKLIEISETTEVADTIRAMAADEYDVILVLFDALSAIAVEISDELYSQYPELKVLLCDSYYANDTKNCVNIICDPWESSFVAGYLAAKTTKKQVVGWIGHSESDTLNRFTYGYEAGVKHANPDISVVKAYTGDSRDSIKGMEAARAMIATYGVDIIYQTANLSGVGVILACKELGVKCIGVDMWQGGEYGQETVFWSALKPIDEAIYDACIKASEGDLEIKQLYFDLSHGAQVYDQRDFDLLDPALQAEISQLTQDIASKKVDVYAGYDAYRYTGE